MSSSEWYGIGAQLEGRAEDSSTLLYHEDNLAIHVPRGAAEYLRIVASEATWLPQIYSSDDMASPGSAQTAG